MSPSDLIQFSFRTREDSLNRFRNEVFDILIIGGGITGAAVARDAASRGLKVALVERKDFAFGTSSRSSKLIHGGLRYLQNFEFSLVFESLAERALLLKTVPHMVRPLPFYLPVYKGDPHGRNLLSLGLWLYDILALFRTPGFHRRLSKREILKDIPYLREDGLLGGFRYFDASMWDDVLAVETLKSAKQWGAAVANYVEAVQPIWKENRITGFEIRDCENPSSQETIPIKAHQTILCVGPWTDQLGQKLSLNWKPWLNPSKGVHLIFDLKKIPIPGAMIMSHPDDGRIVFVIPRLDYGSGVVIVGTTDAPTGKDPDEARVSAQDVQYLMELLRKYFPSLNVSSSDILSAYVGVRPLMGEMVYTPQFAGGKMEPSTALQKVSREHHIDRGPGGTVIVAGGKYTTHRKMAEEIVDFSLKIWKEEGKDPQAPPFPKKIKRSHTRTAVNHRATPEAIRAASEEAEKNKIKIPEELFNRFGADALWIAEQQGQGEGKDPEGFPLLDQQLKYSIHSEMALHLEDFYLRRVALYACRQDHGLPWAESLAQVWGQELGKSPTQIQVELDRLRSEIQKRSDWSTHLQN